MKLTLEMLLYFIRDLKPVVFGDVREKREFLGVKQFYSEDRRMQPEYLYVGKLSEMQSCDKGCTMLAVNDAEGRKIRRDYFPEI